MSYFKRKKYIFLDRAGQNDLLCLENSVLDVSEPKKHPTA